MVQSRIHCDWGLLPRDHEVTKHKFEEVTFVGTNGKVNTVAIKALEGGGCLNVSNREGRGRQVKITGDFHTCGEPGRSRHMTGKVGKGGKGTELTKEAAHVANADTSFGDKLEEFIKFLNSGIVTQTGG